MAAREIIKMAIDRQLKWRQHVEDFGPDQRKILLALSSKKWLWRTFESLQKVTRLSDDALGWGLDELLDQGLVEGSVYRRTREPIFGLIERVGGLK